MRAIKVPLWDTVRCGEIAHAVKTNKDLWIDRGGFYTVGAATYQDSVPDDYIQTAHDYNCHIAVVFGQELIDVAEILESVLGIDTTSNPDTGLPSFHVFDASAAGKVGHAHIDEPHLGIDWKQEVVDTFSFTILVEAPDSGAGMDLWPDHTGAEIDELVASGELPEPVYMPYTLGELVIHDGLTPHRIANPGMGREIRLGEHRITMQGHGATLANGETCVYF